MRKLLLCSGVFFFLFAVLAACSYLPVKSLHTTYITSTGSAINYLSPTPVNIATPTTPTPQAISTPATIKPEIQFVAPEKREVDLTNLGLSDSTRLILYYEPSNSLRTMSGKDVQPQRIPNIDRDANFSRVNLRHISPNYKWFTYYTFKEMKSNLAYYDYWISSIDGKNQWIFISGVSGGTYAEWITNEQIELWHYQSRGDCPTRIAILNPFSKES